MDIHTTMPNSAQEHAVREIISGYSLDIAADKLQQMKQLFPEVFAEDRIDFVKLKAVLGATVFAPQEERYTLSWPGKHDAFREIQKRTTATLVPNHEDSINFETSGNVFIEGENLEVLRVLQKSYYGKVKMIYIDPPYNTGNDSFVYPDDFAERREEYEQRAGLRDEEGYLHKQDLWRKNAKENGQFHSVWLSMMYPRLYLARNLLRDDGVIFVSIDDNEVANLRLLMDEVFGEENFVAEVVWQRTFASKNDAKYFSTEHEYILLFAKDIESLNINLLQRSEKQNARYVNPDNDIRGPWTSTDLLRMEHRNNSVYPILSPTGKVWIPQPGTSWRHPEAEMKLLIENNEITFGTDGNSKPRRKRFLKDVKQGIIPQTIWKHEDVGHTQEAKQHLNKLFESASYFDTPKPIRLVKRCLELTTESNSLILDFFAGSGTTAHAVMELNKEDGGNRKFLCVQMPEPTDEGSEARKAGYRTIADIARARIRKVSEKLQAEQRGALSFGETAQDVGFRSYKLAHSNFKQWRGDVEGTEEIAEQMEIFIDASKPESNQENMLVELLLKAGLPLTARVEAVQAAEHVFYSVRDYGLAIVFDAITPEVVQALRERKPAQVICFDHLFRNNDQFLANTRLQLRDEGIVLTVL